MMSNTLRSILVNALRVINAIRNFLAGYKTYTLIVLSILYSLGVQKGWWAGDLVIWTALGGGTAIAICAACARLLIQFLDDMTKASATPSKQQ